MSKHKLPMLCFPKSFPKNSKIVEREVGEA